MRKRRIVPFGSRKVVADVVLAGVEHQRGQEEDKLRRESENDCRLPSPGRALAEISPMQTGGKAVQGRRF